MAHRIKRFGWIPDLPDHRDHFYAAPLVNLGTLPDKADLRPNCPPVYDQGQLGSCTANAIAGAIQFGRMKEHKQESFVPSRLFIYYNERVIEGTVKSDNGAQLRDGVKTVAKQRICPESVWPYDISKFAVKPPCASLQGRGQGQSEELPPPDPSCEPVERLSCERVSLRLRLHRVREL